MKQDTMETDLIKILEYIGLPVYTIDDNRHYWFIRTQSGSYFDEFFPFRFLDSLSQSDICY